MKNKLIEFLKYNIVGISAFSGVMISFGKMSLLMSANISGVMFGIALSWVILHFKQYSKDKKIAYLFFMGAGFLLLKQVFDLNVYGQEQFLHLWWVVDILLATFALLVAIADNKHDCHEKK